VLDRAWAWTVVDAAERMELSYRQEKMESIK
jgi:hypothetical protein